MIIQSSNYKSYLDSIPHISLLHWDRPIHRGGVVEPSFYEIDRWKTDRKEEFKHRCLQLQIDFLPKRLVDNSIGSIRGNTKYIFMKRDKDEKYFVELISIHLLDPFKSK